MDESHLLEQVPCCVVELDAHGSLLYANRIARQQLNLGHGALAGPRLVDSAIPEHANRVGAALVHALEAGRAVVRFALAGATPAVWLEATFEATDARPPRIVGFAREVTSENELLSWIEMSPLPTVVGRPSDGTILMANDAFIEVSGFDRDQVVGRAGGALAMWTESETRDAVVAALRDHGRIVGMEATFVDAAGETHHALLSAQVTHLMGGEAVVYQTLDITHQRTVEQRLAQIDRIESLAMLAGGMAHDFNNLLQAVMGHLDIAVSRNADPSVGRALTRAGSAAERAAELTRQLLAYAGGSDPEREPVHLDEIADEVLDVLADTALAGIAVDRVRGGDRVSANATQVRQVVLNLLTNAADATVHSHPRKLSVRAAVLSLTGDEGWLPKLDAGRYGVIEVVDNGPGFSPEAALRAFEPFFTTRGTGRGLGLASVLGLVRQFGGGVRLAGTATGACVQVALPRWEDPTPEAAPKNGALRTGSVLVVDDEATVRRAVASMARGGGWTATQADGIESALARLAESTPDVVVLDVRMPDVTGAEGLARVQAAAPGVRVVLMTGFVDESVRAALHEVGFSSLIEKPFTATQLLEALSNAR